MDDEGPRTLFAAIRAAGCARPVDGGGGQPPQVVALVGGGGKTTLAFALATQAAGEGRLRVVVTTTTKMMLPQHSRVSLGGVELGDCPVVFSRGTGGGGGGGGGEGGGEVGGAGAGDDRAVAVREAVLGELRALFVEGDGGGGAKPGFVFLASAIDPDPKYQGRRCLGVEAAVPRALIEAGVCDLVVVEADGSRKLPFKLPAAHEPVLPQCADVVVAVAGLDVVGQPLDEAHVCRAAVVAEACGVPLGAPVTTDVVAAAVADPSLWKVPCRAPDGAGAAPAFVVCLNKADDRERMVHARAASFALRREVRRLGLRPGEGQRVVLATGHHGQLLRSQSLFEPGDLAAAAAVAATGGAGGRDGDGPSYTVRRACEADADAVVTLQQALAAETENGLQLDAERVRAGVLVGLRGAPSSSSSTSSGSAAGAGSSSADGPLLRPRYWVATCARTGEVVGCVGTSPEWSDWWNVAYWWVISIFVDAHHRRRGVGALLLGAVLAAANREAVQTVNLRVESANAGARAFYERLGFVADESHVVMSRGRRPDGGVVGADTARAASASVTGSVHAAPRAGEGDRGGE